MEFYFKAKNDRGQTIEGQREAVDRFTLAREMREEGLIILSAIPADKRKKFSWQKINLMFGRVKLREKIVFANNLSSMISAGLSLSRSLGVLERQTGNKYLAVVLKDVRERVESGDSLSKALSAYPHIFPEVFIAMVSAGEESGNLPGSLKVVSQQMTKSYELKKKIKGAMIYPAIIVCVIMAIAVLMMTFLVPTLTATFSEFEIELPLSTRVVIAVSDWLSANTLLAGLIFLMLLGVVIFAWRTRRGQQIWSYIVIRLPVIGPLARQFNAAVFMRTASALITSGVSMVETLKITERVIQNYYYKEALREAVEKVQTGIGLSAVIVAKGRLFPVLVGEMAMVGEETGNLPGMLMNGAEFFEDEVDQATKNLSTIIEPALMVLIGVAVGFFAISMIGPMYSLSSAI